MAIVIDTGALIKAPTLTALGTQFYTVQRVLNEVRDKHSRQSLALRLEEIIVTEPTEDDLRYAAEFSKKTGDFAVLSSTDLQVIALACRLEKERNGGLALRSAPPAQSPDPPRTDQDPAPVQPEGQDTQMQVDGSLESREIVSEEPMHDADVLAPVQADDPVHDSPEEDDEDGWITPENYRKPSGPSTDLSDPTTSVITTDFAIQNVVLQMGLKLVSLNGRRIRHLKRWVKKCSCCFRLCKDIEKVFCQYCGGQTLYRVTCEMDEAGNVTYKERPQRKVNLRGTKVSDSQYPIPNPKSGKDSTNIILREDELLYMGGRQYSWNKSAHGNPLDQDSAEVFGILRKSDPLAQFGPSRRNPNEPVKGRKKKR